MLKALPCFAITVLILTACGPGDAPAPTEDAAPAEAAELKEPVSELAADGVCMRVGAEQVADLPLEPMGTAGSWAFAGESGALACSEPGPGGVGECEFRGPTVVRVEGGGETFGLRSPGEPGVMLRYGPDGVSCFRAG